MVWSRAMSDEARLHERSERTFPAGTSIPTVRW